MPLSPLTIFISHASELLTDHRAHGDGLIAHGFICNLAARGHRLHIAAPEVALTRALLANVTLYPIKTKLKGRIGHRLEYMLRSRWLLNRLRREHDFDLIHQLNPVVKGLSLAMFGAGLPVVLGLFYSDWPADADTAKPISTWRRCSARLHQAGRKQLLRWQQWQAAALLLATPNAIDVLHQPERVREKIFYVKTGLDTRHFAPSGEATRGQQILFVANLHRRKGILTLLDAFELVAARLPESRLTIVGSGGIEAEVRARAARLAARSRIEFIPHLTRDELPAALRACTVYCLPSYGEPLSNGTLEAMACGKPIVATDAGGLGLLVQPENGRKAPPRDVPALADALIAILTSPELQAQMGRTNRRLIEEQYAWERVVEQLETIYQIVQERRPHAAKQHVTPSLPPAASLEKH